MGELKLAETHLIEFEGLAPTGESKRLIRIPLGRLAQHFQETGNRSKFQEAWLVPDVCTKPAGIWRNLKRTGQEEAFCYAGEPSGEFAEGKGIRIESPRGKVFMVFLTEGLEVTKWRYCEEDPNRPGFPLGHGDRFGERLWPKD